MYARRKMSHWGVDMAHARYLRLPLVDKRQNRLSIPQEMTTRVATPFPKGMARDLYAESTVHTSLAVLCEGANRDPDKNCLYALLHSHSLDYFKFYI